MSHPTINLEHALPIRESEFGFAAHVSIFGGTGWISVTPWRGTEELAQQDRRDLISAAFDEEAA